MREMSDCAPTGSDGLKAGKDNACGAAEGAVAEASTSGTLVFFRLLVDDVVGATAVNRNPKRDTYLIFESCLLVLSCSFHHLHGGT